MFYSAMIIMSNGTRYFLNSIWNHESEAQRIIRDQLSENKFIGCVTAENTYTFINCNQVSSVEIHESHILKNIRETIIENKKYQPENLFRCLKTIYNDKE